MDDTTTIVQEVECSGCDRCEVLRFHNTQELAYKDDVLIELGWTRVHGYYYCKQCSNVGTVR